MRIAFDAKRVFHNQTGLGNYSRSLVGNLQNQFPENKYYLCTPKISDHPFALPYISCPYEIITAENYRPKSLWRSSGVVKDLKKQNIDIYHGLSNELPRGLSESNIRSVVTIHDLLFLDFPGDYKWADRQIYKIKFERACKNADIIIAISEATKERIQFHFKIPEDKIKVIYQPVNPFFKNPSPDIFQETVIKKWEIESDFLLFVNALSPRKNLMGLLKSITRLNQHIPLIVVGPGNFKQAQAFAINNGLNVTFTGAVSNAELRSLYRLCTLFIYPSLGEGFGIPIIEAMMCNAPVLTSNISSMPEAGGDAAEYMDPYDEHDMAAKLSYLLRDSSRRDVMKQKGLENIKRFEGDACAREVMEVYKSIL